MWSDPEDIETWAVSPRGAGWLFGSKVSAAKDSVTEHVKSAVETASSVCVSNHAYGIACCRIVSPNVIARREAGFLGRCIASIVCMFRQPIWGAAMNLWGCVCPAQVTAEFNHINGLSLVCRAHQLVQEGLKYMFQGAQNSVFACWSMPKKCCLAFPACGAVALPRCGGTSMHRMPSFLLARCHVYSCIGSSWRQAQYGAGELGFERNPLVCTRREVIGHSVVSAKLLLPLRQCGIDPVF